MGPTRGRWTAWLVVSAAIVAGLSAPVGPHRGEAGAQASPPDIVVFLTDDQRSDQLTHMPTVGSELADSGVTFDNGFVVNPLCCPSRVSILRGQHSHTTKLYSNGGSFGGFGKVRQFGLERSNLATWLDGEGYRTAMMGKYVNGYANAAHVPQGWDVWRGLTQADSGGYYNYTVSEDGVARSFGTGAANYSTDVLTGYADTFVRGTPAEQPLFLYLAYRAPHLPTTPAQRHKTDARCQRERTDGRPSFNEADVSDKPAYVQAIPPLTETEAKQNGIYRPKRSCRALLSVDEGIGTVLAALSETNRLSNTLIFYVSDNGIQYGEHRFKTVKKVPYEESIRVPFIVRYDPVTATTAGTVDHRFVLNIDIAPTAAAAAGVTPPDPVPCNLPCIQGPVEGDSLLPLLSGQSHEWRSDFLIEHQEGAGANFVPAYCAVRNSQHVFVRYETGDEELYDLAADPFQLQNQADNPAFASLRNTLRARTLELCTPTPPGFSW